VRLDEFPARPVVICFRMPDAREGERVWWLVVEDGVADLCRDDPGRPPTLVVESSVRALTEIWSGDLAPAKAMSSRQVRVEGSARDAARLWTWLGTSAFAPSRHAGRPPILSR
jgi:hypothetical protein